MKRRLTVASILVAIIVLAGPSTGAKDRDNAIVEQAMAAWNAHDADRIAAAYSEDIVYEDVAFGAVNRGRAEMHKFAVDILAAVPDMKLEIVSLAVHDGHGAVEWVWSGTDKGLFKTGKHFSVRGASVFEIRGGKIVSNKDYYDVATVMRQLGLLPAASSGN